MQIEVTRKYDLSWKNVFNGNLKYLPRWRDQAEIAATAKEGGYTYYTWNGWVFSVESPGSQADRLVLASKLDDEDEVEPISSGPP